MKTAPSPEENAVAAAVPIAPGPSLAIPETLVRLAVFSIVYAFAYRHAMAFSGAAAAPMWYPDAVLLAALMLNPPGTWWMYLLAPLPIRLLAVPSSNPAWFLFATFAIDSLKALFAASLLRRGLKGSVLLDTVRRFGVFVLVAVVLAPMLSAFAGAAARHRLGHAYWHSWEQWFLGDALAGLVLTPPILFLVLAWREGRRRPAFRRSVEGLLLAGALLVVAWLGLNSGLGPPYDLLILLYAPVPLLVWSALRFGPFGTSGSLCLIALLAVRSAGLGIGPFAGQPTSESLLSIQLFLLVMGIPMLFLAILVRERNRSVESLRASERRYREVVDSQTDLVCRYLPDGTLTFVNEAYCRFHARDREELIGRRFLDVVPGPVREAARSHLASQLENPRMTTEEREAVLPGGPSRWLSWTAFPVVGPNGLVAEFQAIGHDITDRRRAQEARETLARVSRLALLGEITASIAHEINQPLGAILANAEVGELLLESDGGNPGELKHIFEDIRKDDLRASEVIRHVRSLLHSQRLEIRPIDINAVASEVLQMVGPDAAHRRVTLCRELDPSLPVIPADYVQLQQALLNLVINGMDAMGETDARSRRLTIRTERRGDRALDVVVHDTGPGLTPEVLSRLFDSFFTTKKEGMGLGLSLCRSIVEAHGGSIVAENAAGGGASFRFTLPLKPSTA